MTFLFLLACALLQTTHQQLVAAGSARDRQQALLAAEAGLVDARKGAGLV
ncbi:MAG: hypothetical protein KF760_22110 [Candidatus Eremiobacteraeota bacterium]|nr:hypothetical protein [Candidatus Eremiobacteraeota bacterium]MCW5872024.1 hypothetical protein [Candidatus Eremiobacteraeota bacterium]